VLLRRIIPVLLLQNGGLVKTTRFKNPVYVGDPINAVKIFNEKEADEILLLDIDAAKSNKINYNLITEIAGEAFMPLAYGGGVSSVDQIRKLMKCGIEKIVIGNAAVKNPDFVQLATKTFGSSSISICIDVKKNFFGKHLVVTENGKSFSKYSPNEFALLMQKYGAGEIILQNVDADGTMNGYDYNLINESLKGVMVPAIAAGGAKSAEDLSKVFNYGVGAAAAGSLFVFNGKHKAVLISYISESEINRQQQ